MACSTSRAPASLVLYVNATSAPARAAASAMALPMPLDAPVTNIVRPANDWEGSVI